MKLTHDQLILLQDMLKERITYRETYEEVYDHVLTALEQVDSNIPLGQAINTIMLNDFCGFKGLRKIERKRRWVIGRQALAKQWKNILAHFKLPLLPMNLLFFCLSYYFINELKFRPDALFIILSTVFIGLTLKYVRYFKRKIFLKGTKKSIKDYPLYIISLIPFYISWIGSGLNLLIYKKTFFQSFNLHPLFLSLIFTVYIIYTMSFFKLYLEEFKKLHPISIK